MRRGLQAEFLTYHGKFLDVSDLWMELRPRQTPHPPLWWAGNAEAAAKRGANFIANGSIEQIGRVTKLFREAWERAKAEDTPEIMRPADPLFGGPRRIYIADTDEEARKRAIEAYHSYLSHFAKPMPEGSEGGAAAAFNEVVRNSEWFQKQQTGEVERPAEPNRVATMRITPEQAIEGEALVCGSPSTVRKNVERYCADAGANYFVGSFQWGDLTHEEASKSMRHFSETVMPGLVK